MDDKFLAVNKQYFDLGLKSLDVLILAQINEFNRNDCECYVTNQQLSDLFNESVRTIARVLDRLEGLNFIKREIVIRKEFGRANRFRVMSVNNDIIKASVKFSNCKCQN